MNSLFSLFSGGETKESPEETKKKASLQNEDDVLSSPSTKLPFVPPTSSSNELLEEDCAFDEDIVISSDDDERLTQPDASLASNNGAPSSDALLSYPIIPPDQRLPIGTRIRKEFPPYGWFDGTIQYLSFGNRFYRVQYTDGDSEDLTHADILQWLDDSGTAKKRPARDAPSRVTKKPKPVIRRSTRERKSTVVYVGAHAVKKENNYVVKGLSYVPCTEEASESRPQRQQKTQKKPVARRKPRVMSQAEQDRKAMKLAVQANIAQKAALRGQFFHQHAATLAPFVEPKVLRQVQKAPPACNNQMVEKEQVMQPDGIRGDLRDYQLSGLNFMSRMHEQNVGMILGDEMGLGKTLQTISLICHLQEEFGYQGPSLVICPLSVLYSWCKEIETWAPHLKYLLFHSSSPESLNTDQLGDYDIVVTTYEMSKAKTLARLWAVQHFHLLVLDEGHRIKCSETQVAQAVRKIHAENRLILTGTPLANNLLELHSLLQFLIPDIFSTSEPFAAAFDLTLNVVDSEKLKQAHRLLKLFMLRRLKDEVEKLMPKKIETKVVCPLSNTQIWFYKALLLKDFNLVAGGSRDAHKLSNLVMQLRKCCIHPFLFDGVEDPDTTSLEELVGASGKLSVLDKLLCNLYKKEHRVVLFSQFTRVLDIIEDYCAMRGWKYCRFDGGTARAKRNFVVNSFNAPDSDKFVFLMSTRSGGMGLNLQTADTCILFDSDWNPQPDIQAMARIHRIGQTKTVHVYRLVTDGTVEQRMVERAEKKLYLDRMVTQDGISDKVEDDDDSDRLLATLRFGCNAVFGEGMKKQALPSDDEINVLTDRTRTQDLSVGNIRGGADQTIQDFDTSKNFTATTEFGGIDFERIRAEHQKTKRPQGMGDITDLWVKKRERKNRIKLVDGHGSGYGGSVPVLMANDYDLETGEKSVYDRELTGQKGLGSDYNKKKQAFKNQDFCQVCYEGGDLIHCKRCPVSLHPQCAGVENSSQLLCCSQHNCVVCDRPASSAGGFLFPCASACTKAFCEHHVPKGARALDESRMQELNFEIKNGVYIFCSKECETFSIREFGWELPSKKNRAECPPALDLASNFGGEVDDSTEPAPDELLIVTGKRRRKAVNYAGMDTAKDPPPGAVSNSTSVMNGGFHNRNARGNHFQGGTLSKENFFVASGNSAGASGTTAVHGINGVGLKQQTLMNSFASHRPQPPLTSGSLLLGRSLPSSSMNGLKNPISAHQQQSSNSTANSAASLASLPSSMNGLKNPISAHQQQSSNSTAKSSASLASLPSSMNGLKNPISAHQQQSSNSTAKSSSSLASLPSSMNGLKNSTAKSSASLARLPGSMNGANMKNRAFQQQSSNSTAKSAVTSGRADVIDLTADDE